MWLLWVYIHIHCNNRACKHPYWNLPHQLSSVTGLHKIIIKSVQLLLEHPQPRCTKPSSFSLFNASLLRAFHAFHRNTFEYCQVLNSFWYLKLASITLCSLPYMHHKFWPKAVSLFQPNFQPPKCISFSHICHGRWAVVSRKAKKKQHVHASSDLHDHYSELFTQMAGLNF